jgi:transcriptional regulator PpsR
MDSSAVATILAAASDLTLLLDDEGTIREVLVGQSEHPVEESKGWLGRTWADTVAADSRPAIAQMLKEAATEGVSRRRQVNHPSASGNDVPMVYVTLRPGKGGRDLVAIGRDLRAISALQQRLVEGQQAMERDYRRMRHIESRYRLLCQLSTEAVLLLDGSTQKVLEANPAAALLFDQPARKLVGRTFPFDFDRTSERGITDLLATVRSHGRSDALAVRLSGTGRKVMLSIVLVRQDTGTVCLVRMLPAQEMEEPALASPGAARALRVIESIPDGFVVADQEGTVVYANRGFLDMVEVPTPEQVRGRSLGQWLGRPGADLGVLLATLREHGVARLFGTSLRGELGSQSEVEVSCAAVPDGNRLRLGILVRDVGRRLALGPRGARDLTSAVEQLTGLVGRVSLRNLVRDTADLVEQHFIKAALETTGDNRTSAAEVLGVSRQSLYVKLRRYGLGGIEASEGAPGRRAGTRGRKRSRKR